MSNSLPLVSVVIPTFNHAPYVGDAIESVLGQDYRRFEVIVVDDGSTDDTAQVVAWFGDRVQYVRQENQGLSAARNTGIRLGAGSCVAVLDADDMYEPEFLATLVPILEGDAEAAAVYCGYRFVDERNRALPQVEARQIAPDALYQALVDGNFLVPEAVLVRRRCYDAIGLFDESLRALEDLDMWLRIAGRYKVVGSRRVLTRHRVLAASMSADPERQCVNRLKVIAKHFGAEAAEPGAMTSAQRRAYGRAYLAATIEHLQARCDERAADLFGRAVAVCPELLLELNTFYELACGSQLKGYRGDFASLDVSRNAATLQRMLQSVIDDGGMADRLRDQKNTIRGRANFAVGLLHYGKRELPHARRALFKALAYDPTNALDGHFASTFAKSLLSANLIDWLGRLKPRPAPTGH